MSHLNTRNPRITAPDPAAPARCFPESCDYPTSLFSRKADHLFSLPLSSLCRVTSQLLRLRKQGKLRFVKRRSDVILIIKLTVVDLKQDILAETKRSVEKKGDR